jgi:hypothetical protein
MNRLSNRVLMKAYKDACTIGCEEHFLELLKDEIKRRNILIIKSKGLKDVVRSEIIKRKDIKLIKGQDTEPS